MVAEGVIPAECIDKAILLIRGHKVLLDHDLAALDGGETFTLKKRGSGTVAASLQILCFS